jgi:hypothetical protein
MALPNQKTFLQFQQEISREVLSLSIAGTDDRPNLTEVKQFINDAQHDICNIADWSWLYRETTFNTVQGQTTPYYPLTSTGLAQVEWMTIPSLYRRLSPMSMRDYVARYPGRYTNQSPGIPSFYAESYNDSSNQMGYLLGPGPADAVYSVSVGYKLLPSVMSADGDTPVVPSPYQNLIKYKALTDIYRMLGPGSRERLADVKAEYQRLLDLAWKDDQQNGEVIRTRRDSVSDSFGYQPSLNSVLWHG